MKAMVTETEKVVVTRVNTDLSGKILCKEMAMMAFKMVYAQQSISSGDNLNGVEVIKWKQDFWNCPSVHEGSWGQLQHVVFQINY